MVRAGFTSCEQKELPRTVGPLGAMSSYRWLGDSPCICYLAWVPPSVPCIPSSVSTWVDLQFTHQ